MPEQNQGNDIGYAEDLRSSVKFVIFGLRVSVAFNSAPERSTRYGICCGIPVISVLFLLCFRVAFVLGLDPPPEQSEGHDVGCVAVLRSLVLFSSVCLPAVFRSFLNSAPEENQGDGVFYVEGIRS